MLYSRTNVWERTNPGKGVVGAIQGLMETSVTNLGFHSSDGMASILVLLSVHKKLPAAEKRFTKWIWNPLNRMMTAL